MEQVASFTSTKMLWLKRHEPEVWSQVKHVLLPHDYINYWLTGKMVMEVSWGARAIVVIWAGSHVHEPT